jgi:hypothetical protein
MNQNTKDQIEDLIQHTVMPSYTEDMGLTDEGTKQAIEYTIYLLQRELENID